MLVELKKLKVINEGYKRVISLDKIYVNSSHIISVTDYSGANDFLLSEGSSEYANHSFSLVKVSAGQTSQDFIILGSSEQIFSKLSPKSEKALLNE